MNLKGAVSSAAQTMAMVCFAVIFVTTPFMRSMDSVYFIADLYLVASGLTFFASLSSTRRAGIDYLITMFFFVFLAIPARVQINLGLLPWNAQIATTYLALAYGLMAVSQFCYTIGMSWAQRNWKRPLQDRQPLNVADTVFFSRWALGMAVFALMLAAVVGPGTLFQSRTGAEYGGFTQQFLLISRALSLLSIVILICMARFAPTRRLRQKHILAAVLFLPFFLVINYIPSLPRFSLFGMMIALACPFIDYSRPLVKVPMTAVSLFLLLAVFPVVKEITKEGASLADLIALIGAVPLRSVMLNVDFDGYMWIASTIEYLMDGAGAIRWGNNFLGVVLFFVPRALWHSKPLDTGSTVATGLGYWYHNVSSPLPAESLIAFGLLGPIVVLLITGYVVSHIELASHVPGPKSGRMPVLFLYAVAMGFILIIMRGALNAVAPQFATGFMAYGMMVYARRRRITWRLSKSQARQAVARHYQMKDSA
tara:strand:+ start:7822 stop:9264 length:1443 start_codon:yes stop_codon:yes gene_type:complete